MQNKSTLLFKILLVVLLTAAVGYQLADISKTYTHLTIDKVWVNRNLDSISRSADAAYGSAFLSYITFLRASIPPEANVVDTRTFGEPQYDLYTFMQYFLFPRQVRPLTDDICRGEPTFDRCIELLLRKGNYFIYGKGYKPSKEISQQFDVIPFNSDMGVIKPSKVEGK
jgi:hypothetical protein